MEETETGASALNQWKYPISFLALGLLPTGAPALFMFFSLVGLCKGAIGSGITCSVPFGGYFEGVGGFWEISMIFFGFGILWFAFAIAIWIFALYSLLYVGSSAARLLLPKPTIYSFFITTGILGILAIIFVALLISDTVNL